MGNKDVQGALEPPPTARDDARTVEILRAWATPNGPVHIALRVAWEDPAAWGLLLVDLARHAANAYAHRGHDAEEALARIRQGFDAEWSSPTDDPEDLTDRKN